MSEPTRDPTRLSVTLTVSELEEIIESAVTRALANGPGHPAEKSRLLSPDEAAELIGVKKAWLFRHAGRLPFCRKLSRKNVRFDEMGLKRWLSTRK